MGIHIRFCHHSLQRQERRWFSSQAFRVQASGSAINPTWTEGSDGKAVPYIASFVPASNLADVPASITATTGAPQSATVNTVFVAALQATVKDSASSTVCGATVTFTAPASGASATFGGSATAAVTTNASGIATAPALTANSQTGSYSVAASVSGVSTPASFSLTNVAGTPASISATSGTPQSATVNTAFATALQAMVKDAYNNPVGGVSVIFTAPSTEVGAAFSGSATATTNSSGVATVTHTHGQQSNPQLHGDGDSRRSLHAGELLTHQQRWGGGEH
jgi:hypothetical protein